MLRLLIAAGALASFSVVAPGYAQTVSAATDANAAHDDDKADTTPPVDGASAANDPLGAARAAIDRAKALTAGHDFQAGIQRQRANAATLDTQPMTPPQFDLHSPQPLGPAAMGDALAPPVRQWAMENRQPLLILVSFAMPDSELQELAAQGARIGAPLVLRGLVDDSFPATQKRLMKFRQIHGASFRIDPTLFRRFGVDQVPTFVLPLEALQTCSTANCPAPAHVAVTGDAGLDYVLDEIDRHSSGPRAHALAQQLRAQFGANPPP